MNSLFKVIINSIKVKFISITSRLRMWLNPSFVMARLLGAIRQFFTRLFDVKPRHKDDYYKLFGWLVSKRLAFAIVVVAGALSLVFLVSSNRDLFDRVKTGGIKTYNYNSIPLRFAKGDVRIKARKGYIAYEGAVKSGGCNGQGTLYNENGGVVYKGAFVANRYEGKGTSYYNNGARSYTGDFVNNYYDGTGKAFRETGSLLYDGEFAIGLKEGAGVLYDESGNVIYTGQFLSDRIQYSELIGKTASQVREMYTGVRSIYSNTDTGESLVMMPQINALYKGSRDSESTNDEVMVDEIYVIENSFRIGTGEYKNISEITKLFGPPSYQGTSAVVPAEAVIINKLNESSEEEIMYGNVDMETVVQFSDFQEISNIDPDYKVYIYSYPSDGLVYTFVCKDNDGFFDFYSIVLDE